MSVNKAIVLGRVGAVPELKYTAGQMAVCTFNLATTEKYKAGGEDKEETTWHRIVVWGAMGELCSKVLVKGDKVFIEGRMRLKTWTDKDNNQRSTLEIHTTHVEFPDKKQEEKQDPAPQKKEAQMNFTANDIDFQE